MITLKSVDKILCRYVNQTFQFQIIRISNIPHWFFERTVIPGDFVLFEAFREAQLEVHTSAMANSILSDMIPCGKLAQTNDLSIQSTRRVRPDRIEIEGAVAESLPNAMFNLYQDD